MSISIRAATVFDAKILYNMILELAIYEKEEASVFVTESDLEQQLRQSQPPFECLVAESNGNPCGFALYFHGYSTWEGTRTLHLEDLYVNPSYRGCGIGLALMKRLAQVAGEQGCKRFEWSVLNWNELAINFYEQIGAVPMSDWTRYRMDADAIAGLTNSGARKLA